jgi:hypothetical protein
MVEIHLECPNCKRNIITKLQSEVYINDSHRPVPVSHIHGRARAISRGLSETGAKVNIQLKDGTLREVKGYEELLAVFAGLRQEQRCAEQVQRMTDAQITQRIADVEQRVNTLKKLSWSLTKEDKRLFNYVIRPIESQLQLLTEEQEHRTLKKPKKE